MNKITLAIGGLALISTHVYSAPFTNCPSKAYLFQGTPASIYGVNLVSGSSELLTNDVGTTSNVNGVGFNFTDRYIYGYATSDLQVVRMGADYQVEPLNVNGLPNGVNFYVGDVYDHTYYVYRNGEGFYRIPLSPLDNDPNATLEAELITTSTPVKLTDFAVNPVDGKMYGIDNKSGFLYQFDLQTGDAVEVGDTGELGTFGAGYFDVNGNYYVSRNQDGLVYRVALGDSDEIAAGNVTAIKFADGPSSGQNDGARCANAPVIDEDSNIDFGDAPDSYATTLDSNGPRHELDNLTWLGVDAPDGDSGATVWPSSDDATGVSDEQGASFVTSIEPGLDSIVNLYASTSGYVSAWVDWNADGQFGDDEQILTDDSVSAGNNVRIIEVPIEAQKTETWARYRISQQTGLGATGGAKTGEVEDHLETVDDVDTTRRYFPSQDAFVTLAYEDKWPLTDDYDLNDVVFHYNVTETLKSDEVAKSQVSGELLAVGADFRSGFAVRIPGVSPTNIDTTKTRLLINGVQQPSANLESGTVDASFIILADTKEASETACQFYRTEMGCKENINVTFELHVSYLEPVALDEIGEMPYDPFIFATENRYRGNLFGDNYPGRGLEIHLADKAPTAKFNSDFFDSNYFGVEIDDDSNANSGKYFKTSNNLPWAIMIFDEWEWPQERVDLLQAYPDFQQYCESGGFENQNWYSNSITNKIYR